ncbi:hypothetical protein LIER_04104 [Lithospermum erythrorhizon]|uniref:Uncharacterized protein n=1 Tax=Lithospermum erythrorhizon TaxID=34254 RepID=A0AAV3P090_LITER
MWEASDGGNSLKEPRAEEAVSLDRIRALDIGYSKADLPRGSAFLLLQGDPRKKELGMSRAQIRQVATPLVGFMGDAPEEGLRLQPGLHKVLKGIDGGGIVIQKVRGTSGLECVHFSSSEESPKKMRPYEEIQSVPFDERDPAKVFKIGTTLGQHEALLIRVLRDY